MAIYLEYEGIKGNVTAEGYKDHIEVLSAKLGVARKISMEPGRVVNRECSHPNISELTLIKLTDSSTAAIFKEAISGSVGKTASLKFVKTAADGVQEYMNYILEDCLISRYKFNCNAEHAPIERVKLSFSELLVTYIDYDLSNKLGAPQRAGYDLKAAKSL